MDDSLIQPIDISQLNDVVKKDIEELQKLESSITDEQIQAYDAFMKLLGEEDVAESFHRPKPDLKNILYDVNGVELQYERSVMRKPAKVELELTEDYIKELTYCYQHPLYTIKNYFKIINMDCGLMNFELYQYQATFIKTCFDNKRVVAKWPRQAGKTTTSAAFILFFVLFSQDKTVAIVANKQNAAIEILDRIKLMYEYLPMWMKPGVIEWNKGSLKFDNGCKIMAAATSSSSIRGQSIACVDGSTIITVNSPDYGVEHIRIDDLKKRFSKNDNYRVNENQTVLKNYDYKVLTPNGFSKFDGLVITTDKETIKLKDMNLICTPNHRVKIDDVFVEVETLPHEKYIDSQNVYDLLNVEKDNEYFTNDIVSHNCLYLDEFAFVQKNLVKEFIESTFPVISSSKLARIIITSTPNGKNHFYRMFTEADAGKSTFKALSIKWNDVPGRDEAWKIAQISELGSIEKFNQEYGAEFTESSNMAFSAETLRHIEKVQLRRAISCNVKYTEGLLIFEKPLKNKKYLIAVDVGEGRGQDNSAFVVLDITKDDIFKVVASYQNPKMQTADYPTVIYNLAMYYYEAFVLIENNSIGDGVANQLWYNLEYENVFNSDFTKETKTKKKGYLEIGIRTSKKTKKQGVLYLSHLLNKHKLIVTDARILEEMYAFTEADNGTYQAENGSTDDFVMALAIFAYLARTKDSFDLLKGSYTDYDDNSTDYKDSVMYVEGNKMQGKNRKNEEADAMLLNILLSDKGRGSDEKITNSHNPFSYIVPPKNYKRKKS